MSFLPDLQHVGSAERLAIYEPVVQRVIQLMPTMTFEQARAVPGAVYDPAYKSMVLLLPSPRAAIVALTLKPQLGQEYPELIELRDTLLTTVRPTDHATELGLKIHAPGVRQSLVDQGSDWLHFELYEGASQETDLGYAAAILGKYHFFYVGWARGYGKTLGTAALIEHHGYNRVLVAAPNSSKVDTWKLELELRLPSHQVFIMPNEKVQRLALLDFLRTTPPERFVLVTHHESLSLVAKWGRRDGKDDPKYGGWRRLHITWDLFAFDEVHRLAHVKTRMHQGARNVPAHNRLGLSGSVYQNDWDELYGPLHWGMPTVYAKHVEDWSARHFDYVDGYGRQKIWAGFLPGHDQMIRDELGVFMIVREKPDKTIKNIRLVELSTEQRRVYEELSNLYMSRLDDETFIVAQEGVVMLTRLRQIASGLELLAAHMADSTKLDATVAEIQETWNERRDDFFVAAWYRASAFSLRERLSEVGITAYVITGDTPTGKRPGIIAAARADAGVPNRAAPVVLIGTIPTLGESANLQFLNHVIRIDRSWNPALNRQVVDRVDRTGQTRDAYLTDIIAKDTVDELVVMPNLANKDAMRAMLLGRIS